MAGKRLQGQKTTHRKKTEGVKGTLQNGVRRGEGVWGRESEEYQRRATGPSTSIKCMALLSRRWWPHAIGREGRGGEWRNREWKNKVVGVWGVEEWRVGEFGSGEWGSRDEGEMD